MRSIFFTFCIVALFIIFFPGCGKTCDSGYEGKRCDTEIREKFEGVWNAVDSPGIAPYRDTISTGAALTDLVISPQFAGSYFSNPIKASANANIITINRQSPDSNAYYVKGTGTISSDQRKISWSYSLVTPNDSTNFIGIWSK